MKKLKKVSLMVSILALLVAIPGLVAGQTAPASGDGGAGKPTPVPTSTPVVGNNNCDGGLKKFEFKPIGHWDVGDRDHRFGTDDRDGRDHH